MLNILIFTIQKYNVNILTSAYTIGGPIWIGILFIGYKIKNATKK